MMQGPYRDSSSMYQTMQSQKSALSKVQAFIEGKHSRGFSFKTLRKAFDLLDSFDPKDRQSIVTTLTSFKAHVSAHQGGDAARRKTLIEDLDKVINVFAGLDSKTSLQDAFTEWQNDFLQTGSLFNTSLQLSAAVARRADKLNPYQSRNSRPQTNPQYRCWVCKKSGHTRTNCPEQYSNDPIDMSRICQPYNSHRGCHKSANNCSKIHICSKCRLIHRNHPVHKCQA